MKIVFFNKPFWQKPSFKFTNYMIPALHFHLNPVHLYTIKTSYNLLMLY
jgi:hypothetical protein